MPKTGLGQVFNIKTVQTLILHKNGLSLTQPQKLAQEGRIAQGL